MIDRNLIERARNQAPSPAMTPLQVRLRGDQQKRRQRLAAVVGLSGLALVLFMALQSTFRDDDPGLATDVPIETLGIGRLTHLPPDWEVTSRRASENQVEACLGPAGEPCAVEVQVATEAAIAADTGVTLPIDIWQGCQGPMNIVMRAAGSGALGEIERVTTPKCHGESAGPVGWMYANRMASVIPNSASNAKQAREILRGIDSAHEEPQGPKSAAPSQG